MKNSLYRKREYTTASEERGSMEKLTLTPSEIQKLVGWGRDFTIRLIHEGKLPNVGNTKRFLVPRSAVLRFLEIAGQ
jgi:excisionase family DNA binding protein